ncbi:YheC/YheD family protein [Paenibacillus sp. MZ04-78.2]|uniref:YheC/YheD family protein n=1 Tax=Paenibacillus sp. MZ04-78.2 TaxID=2962034 RepID=UPI0020B6DB80|nr:YheC/YheD family protein [Paenibacillus sp. MZ04-78.2]MCP3776389.1 YheC/YheD family protein [Paenibacillus sp. MZ04-78.2]
MSATKDKWLKYRFLKNYKRLTRYVPRTKLMSESALWKMISKYRHVILKPVRGSRGRGIIQVSSMGGHTYALHYENVNMKIRGKENTYKFLQKKIGYTRYMIQRRIDRPTIGGCPFDMRVILQRKKTSRKWELTAKIAKVAGRGYVVSNNERSKGRLLPVKTAIRKSTIHHLSSTRLRWKMKRISLRAARRLSNLFPHHRIYGLDVGFDLKGHPWIIEANLYPSMSHFLKLKDRTMYRRIMAYKKQ